MESKLDMGPATVFQENASVKRMNQKVSYMIFFFFTFFIRSYIRYEHVSQKSK